LNSVAIYCRLSDEDKNKLKDSDDSESIQNQKNLLIKYAAEKGWDIYKIYSDDDYSGLDKDRPEFNQMLSDAENGKFNIILCKHQSRFTRDMELVEKYLHGKFVEWGIRFITVVDGVDTFDRHNKKSRQINGLVNEWYCEDISESIRAVFKIKQGRGEFIGSFASYGYMKDPSDKHKLIIDEEAADVVRKIYSLYLGGNGTQHIANVLNKEGIPNPTKYKERQGLKYKNAAVKDNFGLWNKTTVKRILKNQIYVGDMVQNKYKKVSYKSKRLQNQRECDWIIVNDTHEPIIDEETYNLVQERLKSSSRSSGVGQTFVFAGKLKCMGCGSTMSKATNQVGKSYLRCKLYASAPGKKLCTSHSIRLDVLENIVSQKIRGYIKALCDENEMGRKLFQEQGIDERLKSYEREVDKLSKDIDGRTNALKNLYLDKVRGVLDEAQFLEYNTLFKKDKEELEARKNKLVNNIEELKSKANDFDEYVKLVKKYKDFIELTSIMVNELIEYIEIGEKDKDTGEQKVKINWKF
jgi:site-specific DNA recombinase